MSFSLYGALPPSKTDKDSEKHEKRKTIPNTGMSGLYSSLPAPESGSTAFQASKDPITATATNAPITTETQTTEVTETATPAVAPTQPTGWSAFNKFRPVIRRPTIQAKPKLNKPFIPAGATIVSEKTVTKEERELELQKQQKAAEAAAVATAASSKSSSETTVHPKNDNIDLGAIPFLTSVDDVNGFRTNQKSKKKNKKGKLNANSNTQPLPTIFNMMEDYDPHKPNDYEQYKEERREFKEQQRKKRDWERRQNRSASKSRSYSRSRSRSRSYSPSPSRSTSRSRSRSRSRSPYYSRSQSPEPAHRGRRTPPLSARTYQESPKINVKESAEDAYKRRMMMSQPQQVETPKQYLPTTTRNDEVNPAHDIAQKILTKYGWQEGHGLGKDGSGMKEAIEVKPTGRGTGILVDHPAQAPSGRQEDVSPVILLTNMVGPGEVDDMLQEETADECSKYGKVERCLIFEVPRGKIPDDRAVRIFIKFSNVDSAKRAIQDLNGRFFGGRVVTATYFDNGRFEKLDLAPSRQEFYRNA